MNTRRIFIIILGIVALAAGLISGYRIYYGVFMIMCLTVVFSGIYTLLIFLTLRYSQSISENIIAKGSELSLKIHLQNNLPLSIPRLVFRYNMTECSIAELHQDKQIWLRPFGNSYSEFNFNAEYSGNFTIGLVSITVYCPFGLYKISIDMKRFRFLKPINLVVLPAVNTPDNINLNSMMSEGNNHLYHQLHENSIQVDHPKKYTYGDTLRSIHWKLSMRTGELYSKKYEETSQPSLTLLLDCYEHGYIGLDAIKIEDTLAESSSTILNYALNNNLSTRLIAYSNSVVRINGNSTLDFGRFMESMANISYHSNSSIVDVLQIELITGSTLSITSGSDRANISEGINGGVILITTNIPSALFDELVWLKTYGINIRVIYISLYGLRGNMTKTINELTNAGVGTVHLTVEDDVLLSVEKL
ncbi:MAG: DUF58 domain-containing protein [Oscillospiraceae bacterium]|nr:DUF58 domain-containing protein [Oscillospiraceae bacterium]